MKKLIALTLSISTFSSFAFGPLPSPVCHKVTVNEVKNKIKELGVKGYIDYSQPEAQYGEWECVMDNITNGLPEWLDLVPTLAPFTDAGTAEDLGLVLSVALQTNPTRVLDLIDNRSQVLNEREICSLPFYDGTREERNQYVVNIIEALYKVTNGKYCLSHIVSVIGQSTAEDFYKVN
jgi:hypothetical protein